MQLKKCNTWHIKYFPIWFGLALYDYRRINPTYANFVCVTARLFGQNKKPGSFDRYVNIESSETRFILFCRTNDLARSSIYFHFSTNATLYILIIPPFNSLVARTVTVLESWHPNRLILLPIRDRSPHPSSCCAKAFPDTALRNAFANLKLPDSAVKISLRNCVGRI